MVPHRHGHSARSEVNEPAASDDDDRFSFHLGLECTLEAFQRYADNFKEQYFRVKDSYKDMCSSDHESKIKKELLVEDIEGEYWRLLEKASEQDEVQTQILKNPNRVAVHHMEEFVIFLPTANGGLSIPAVTSYVNEKRRENYLLHASPMSYESSPTLHLAILWFPRSWGSENQRFSLIATDVRKQHTCFHTRTIHYILLS
ncbi:Lysine-specific demethylase [Nymphaea thermarum]|nr:Lysine-specific demethylase [Nymphaea thermarum]